MVHDLTGGGMSRFASHHSVLYVAICIILIIFMICSKFIISFIVFVIRSLIRLTQGIGEEIE
jgi:hypothetical protein